MLNKTSCARQNADDQDAGGVALKRFLVATDLSPRAAKALARATRLAEEHRATLTVLHISAGEAGRETRDQQNASKIEGSLRREIEALSFPNGTTANIRVLTGTPFVEIIRRSREEAVDLAIVGAHGADFIKDLVLGTTAEKIARKGDRSVLVVKQPARQSYRRVLVAVDFSDNSRRALEFALRLAPKADFHVLHVYPEFEGMLKQADIVDSHIMRYQRRMAKAARQRIETFMRTVDSHGKPISGEVSNGRARREITTVAKRLRADLVVVGTAGRTGIPYILLGSVAEHVMREALCDVLVVRSGSLPFVLP